MTRTGPTLALLIGACLGLAGCSVTIDSGLNDDGAGPVDPRDTNGGDRTSFNHPNGGPSVWDIVSRVQTQGPPEVTARMHACPKIQYATLGNVLTSLGVDLASTTPLSAGALYQGAANALAVPSYANRIRENFAITTSGSSALFDIFAAAAPEIIAALPNLERCKVGGVAPVLFDTAGCHAEGITCLIGIPAQSGHVEICNLTLSRASDPAVGQRIAVAALVAAAYTCN